MILIFINSEYNKREVQHNKPHQQNHFLRRHICQVFYKLLIAPTATTLIRKQNVNKYEILYKILVNTFLL